MTSWISTWRGKAGVPTEHRLRMTKLVRDLTSSYEDVLTIHAEGSLEAQKLSILALGDFDRYKGGSEAGGTDSGGSRTPSVRRAPGISAEALEGARDSGSPAALSPGLNQEAKGGRPMHVRDLFALNGNVAVDGGQTVLA